jgi:hypothetical protein
MKMYNILFTLFLLPLSLKGQIIHGIVKDYKSGEDIKGALFLIVDTNTNRLENGKSYSYAGASDDYGTFHIKVPLNDTFNLVVKCISNEQTWYFDIIIKGIHISDSDLNIGTIYLYKACESIITPRKLAKDKINQKCYDFGEYGRGEYDKKGKIRFSVPCPIDKNIINYYYTNTDYQDLSGTFMMFYNDMHICN